MPKVRRHKDKGSGVKSPFQATLSSSWIPLTFAFLFYTSGIQFSFGESSTKASTDEDDGNETTTKNYNLTGNPQIDYVHDPNLPRELNGYNLSDYPFFSRVPKDINFSCDGLKDGFYASILHKCQVYHHCLFGTRYDFLCANYTAFDQKTFICQFVSDVDCPNSALFFHRNDQLYVTKSTTEAPRARPRPGLYDRRRPPPRKSIRDRDETADPPGASKTEDPVPITNKETAVQEDDRYPPEQEYESEEEDYRPVRRKPARRRCKNKRRCRQMQRRRRPRPRPRPVYYDEYDDDYDDYDAQYDDDYYDDRPKRGGRKKDKPRAGNKVAGSKQIEIESDVTTPKSTTTVSTSTTTTTIVPELDPPEESEEPQDSEVLTKNREDILTKSRPPPRIRQFQFQNPGSKTERNKPDAIPVRTTNAPSTTTRTTTPLPLTGDDYYYDNEEVDPVPSPKASPKQSPKTTTTLSPRQKFQNRNFRPSFATTKATTTTTTPATTTTKPSTTTTPRAQRKFTPVSTTTATTTTTTTPDPPQYEYEYEYEDEIPSSSVANPPPMTTTTATTTTTSTAKPARPSANRGNKRPPFPSSIQTSTSVSFHETEDADLDDSQNAINRRQSSWSRGQNRGSTSSASSSASPTLPSPTTLATSEKSQIPRGNRQQFQQEPLITVKSQSTPFLSPTPQYPSTPAIGKQTTETVVKAKPSRFWQRPTKVVASTSTTTEGPVALVSDYDYSDQEELPEPPTSPMIRYNSLPPQTTPSRFKSTPGLVPSSTSSYQDRDPVSNYRGQYTSSQTAPPPQLPPQQPQQYLRATISQSPQPQNIYRDRDRVPVNPHQQQPQSHSPANFISQYGPSPSSMGIQFQHHLPQSSTSSRPEFISLLRDDEDAAYYEPELMSQIHHPSPMRGSISYSRSSSSVNSNVNPNSNSNRRFPPTPQRTQYFGGTGPSGSYHPNSQKNLYSAAQETYHSFLPAPSRFLGIAMSDLSVGGPSGMPMILYATKTNNKGSNNYRNADFDAAMLGGK